MSSTLDQTTTTTEASSAPRSDPAGRGWVLAGLGAGVPLDQPPGRAGAALGQRQHDVLGHVEVEAALGAVEVVLGHPGGGEAELVGAGDLLEREAVAVRGGRLLVLVRHIRILLIQTKSLGLSSKLLVSVCVRAAIGRRLFR